jgi:SEC-C motif domain protein
MKNLCYCGLTLPFEDCCKPIIECTKQAETAEALMRSRYSAHVIVDSQYIVDSTHISTRANHLKVEIEAWAKICTWQKLEIISTTKGLQNDLIGEVEFKAYFIDVNKNPQIHHEKSVFKKENNKWLFVNGKVFPAKTNDKISIDRNAPCPCGSGKKFKKCCGL